MSSSRRALHAWSVVCLPWMACGCSLLAPPPPGEVLDRAEAEFDNPYKLYQPTHFDHQRPWPLVVLCAEPPWPGPDVLISDWGRLAEEEGLLLVAPELAAGGARFETTDLQRDEQRILSTLEHIRGRSPLRDDRIMIVGYGKAARPAAYVGLRHPEIFRVVALLQPHFDPEDLTAVEPYLDAHQPSLIVVKFGDLQKDKSIDVARWLQTRQISASEVKTSGARHTFVDVVQQFWQRMLRQQPWVRIQLLHLQTPRRVRFQVQTSVKNVVRYEWDFGDGTTDLSARPEHTYRKPGSYDVTLRLYPTRNEYHERRVRVSVAN